ncbi:MAG TPA: GntR family transcriptional regulator [bacterium]|nr:GntR family transcriptional regulator [bacterium]
MQPVQALPTLSVQRLTDAVYRTLKEQILARKFRPGQRLKVDELAAQLGVSRTPLKDSLNVLASEGLIEIVPRKGTFVTDLSADDIAEVFEIRRALERLAAETVVDRISSDGLAELREQLDALQRAADRRDAAEHMRRNLTFHQLFVQFSGNRRLLELYEGLRAHIQIGRVHARRTNWHQRLRQEQAEHREILAALEAGDAARLSAAVDAHIRRAKASLIRDLEARELVAASPGAHQAPARRLDGRKAGN